jgi:hypothetical protein
MGTVNIMKEALTKEERHAMKSILERVVKGELPISKYDEDLAKSVIYKLDY